MYNQRIYSLVNNRYAGVSQPIYLLIVIVVVAVIISTFVLASQQMLIDAGIQQVEQEVDKMTTQASAMFEYADEGTIITLHIELPPSLRFIVFGSLPTNNSNEPSLLALDDNTSNNYYFMMNDGTIRSYHTNARFSNQDFTQVVLLHPGVYDLTLELRSHEGRTYVTIY
jgi:hypothetical protein